MSGSVELYLSQDRLGLQVARPVRGRYEVHSPLEPVRAGWAFEYRPCRPNEPDRGEWVLWDEGGREAYREPGPSLGPQSHEARVSDTAHISNRAHLAEIGLLEAMVVPWRLGMSFSLDGALWRRIDERQGLLLTSNGEPMLHVTLDEFERTRQLRSLSADGDLLVSWEPLL